MSTVCKLPGCGKNVYPGHEFCSRSHGLMFTSNKPIVNSPQTPVSSNSNTTTTCKLSGCNKVVYSSYEFCGRDHGRQFNSNNAQNGASPNHNSSNQTQATNNSNTTPICKLSGCNKAAYPGYEFCCRDHGRQFNSNNAQNGASPHHNSFESHTSR
ncbi:hypothetical protein DICPUDRAFT_84259 [Dictyostelium purpureum]|uniref:Uncharacterized protein n=1 Tax=Dictyostelium purpureum TaxID=5786 RepID=F1A230_DICPU|nr:uncharacterized protein DICPUDRAFT_84259 [Dictyostelium purpureum]EGC29758.1 hypothetical protein DICPUDRAFT_84259 [Dictyostelium purpureum]|eukprot:XP_003293726.1 hypothetical protein DICPUDRAFT_84259 [Dictyostelium purpureum]